jgi:predicted transcriptional regulator
MEKVKKIIKKALLEREMNQKEFCDKTNRNTGNFNRKLNENDCKLSFIKEVASDLGYDVEISFIDRSTGEKL